MAKSLLSFLAVAAQLSAAAEVASHRVLYVDAEVKGEEYRRLNEPMPQFVAESTTCPTTQVHLTLGGSGSQSVTVSWANSALLSTSVVTYGTSAASLSMTATGTATMYTQLLAPLSGNLVTPSMGAPGATASQIIALSNTSSFAYDHLTGKRWANYKNAKTYATGQLGYSNPYAYYDSPMIHTTVLTGLVAGVTYYYRPANTCKTYSFTTTQAVATYPFKAGLVADLGTTAVSAKSIAVLASMKASVIIFTGDLSYADGWTPTWDTFGLMMESLASSVPILSVGGNHELGSSENWQSYSARYPTNPQDSNSPNFCFHGREVGPMNIISLCSYSAANYAGLNTGATSLQYQWLVNYLPTIDRNRTPWIMVQFHVPVYCTNSGHYMEGEIFRRQYEPLLYSYGVDIVMNGHVHAYERSFPVYNNTVNPCGITHLVLGDAGNYENAYVPWITPQASWSAFREASFGVASLNVMSATQANYTWHRHACGAISPGTPNYNQNFNSSCVTPLDNSATVMQAIDNYIMTRPSQAACPNRYVSAVPLPTYLPTPAPTMAPSVMPTAAPSATPTVAPTAMPTIMPTTKPTVAPSASPTVMPSAMPTIMPSVMPSIQPSSIPTTMPISSRRSLDEAAQMRKVNVEFVEAEFQGESYRRLLEPMTQYVPDAATCSTTQVHLTLGGSGSQSVSVCWTNPALLSSSTVMYGTSASSMLMSATGTATMYTQLLAPLSGNLVTPSMGAPGATASQIIALSNTSSFAYDHLTGKRWANYKNAKTYATGQLGYSNPYAYYDSPMIHTTVLTGLVAGVTYYYVPANACKTYSFTMTQAVATYPFKAGLVADLGTTAVSAKSVAVLMSMSASVIIFTGDLSYADGWTPIWDTFGVLMEPLAAYVPILSVGGNHELGSYENWQSYNARYPTNQQDSSSPNFCFHGREVGPMNIISLCSYSAANYAGLNTGATSLQYQWLVNYLPTIDRNRTPWIMVQFHVPVYCTNSGHYMEGEIFRRQYEPLLYSYGVDIVMNGHVHAYERSFPVYNNTVNPCGITHLVLGDAGNYENAYVPWITPQASWSAFREASFGVASLNVMSATQANYTWHRHACGAISPGTPNYNQNFNSSCVTPLDNSATVMQAIDNYIMTRPSQAACPNRYVSAVAMATNTPTMGPTPVAGTPTMGPTPVAGTPTMSPTTLVTNKIAATQTITGISATAAASSGFKTDLTIALQTSLNVAVGAVVVNSVTYVATSRRVLLSGDSVVVTYTVTVSNSKTSVVIAALATAVSSGAITNSLVSSGFTSASAAAAATTVDMSPTSAPTFHGPYTANSCFAGSETVAMESGDVKSISEIVVGDRVLAANADGKTVYSEVVYVPHGANKENALFVRITTESGRDVKMTQNHILPAGVCGSTLPLVYATKVSVGSCIQTVSGEERVSVVETVQGEGVYTVVTKEEFVVVNGIIASPFGANHMMANLFYNIHRFVYTMSPMLLASSVLNNANEALGMMIPFFGPSAGVV